MLGGVLDERTIRYIAAVDRLGSIRAAARELRLAPSAVQRTIVAAERQVGMELFERGTRGAVATEAGRLVAAQARDRHDLDLQLATQLDELRGLSRGHVTVATGEGFVAELWERVVAPFLKHHPGVELDLLTGGTDDLFELLVADRVDLVVALHPPVAREVRTIRTRNEPLRVVCPPDHPFAARGSVHPTELEGLDLAVLPGRFGIRTLHDQLLRAHGVTVNVRIQSESQRAVVRAVTGGLALALLPRVTVGEDVEAGRLVAVPLEDPQVSRVEAKLLVRRDRRLLPAASTFVAACAEGMFGPGSSRG